jgi:hypothetical protein
MVQRVSDNANSSSPHRSPTVAFVSVLRRHSIYWGCLACCLPMLCANAATMWRFSHLRYIVFIPIGIAFILLRESRRQNFPTLISKWWDQMLVVGGALTLLAAIWLRDSRLAVMAVILVAGTIILRLRRDRSVGQVFPLWLFLIFLLPLPAQLDMKAMHLMQSVSVKWGSMLLDGAGYLHVRLGNVIWASGKDYFVDEAFRGIGGAFSLLVLSAWLLVLNRRPIIHAIVLMTSAVFWACAVYALWIFVVVLIDQSLEINLLKSSLNPVAELAMAALAAGMLVCTDVAIATYPGKVRRVQWHGDPGVDEGQLTTLHNTLPTDTFGKTAIGTFGVLLLLQTVVVSQSTTWGTASGLTFQQDTLAKEINGWQQTEFDTRQRDATDLRGEFTASWAYEKDDQKIFVTLDYPFSEWHELPRCYETKGDIWNDSVVMERDSFPEKLVDADLIMADGTQATLMFTMLRDNGQIVEPAKDARATLVGRAKNTVRSWVASPMDGDERPGIQVQILHIGPTSSGEKQRGEQAELLVSAARQVLAIVKTSGGGSAK